MNVPFDLSKYIAPIELNLLKGRMVDAPAIFGPKSAPNILFIHGHHSSHERLQGIAELLRSYGNVCMPDLPGFGGMDNFYSIGEKPTFDNFADYLAAFIKLHYGSRKKFLIIGYSFGFMVVARMLQKYPELHKQLIDVVSVAGVVNKDELKFTKKRRFWYLLLCSVIHTRVGSWVFRELFLRKWSLSSIYTKTHNAREKFAGLDKQTLKKHINFEIKLWRINDVRTWTYTSTQMLRGDLVTGAAQLPLNLISIVIDNDKYFKSKVTEQHFKLLFKNVRTMVAPTEQHGGSMIETADDAKEFFPLAMRKYMEDMVKK